MFRISYESANLFSIKNEGLFNFFWSSQKRPKQAMHETNISDSLIEEQKTIPKIRKSSVNSLAIFLPCNWMPIDFDLYNCGHASYITILATSL